VQVHYNCSVDQTHDRQCVYNELLHDIERSSIILNHILQNYRESTADELCVWAARLTFIFLPCSNLCVVCCPLSNLRWLKCL